MFGRIFIVGYGRLGAALAQQIDHCGMHVFGVVLRKNHNDFPYPAFLDLSSFKEQLIPGDAVFLTVPDAQINDLGLALDLPGISIIHCSGATEIFKVKQGFSGVFYPLMTFTNTAKINNWAEIPVFLESGDENTMLYLREFSTRLGVNKTYCIDSHQRQKVHVSAVIANNMIQALYAAAANYLSENDLPQEVLLPIINQMTSRWGETDPIKSLTGPMVRGDMKTISLHEELLVNNPELLDVYRDINKLIARLLENRGNS